MANGKCCQRTHSAWRLVASVMLLAAALNGCSLFQSNKAPKSETPGDSAETNVSGDTVKQKTPSLPAFAKDVDTTIGQRVGVNRFLWQGALDTVSFMPLVSADPFGGVIITDWYAPPETPQERFKLNVFILSRELRADAVRVAVFHQKQTDGQWQDMPAEGGTATDLEDTILSQAQKLRSQALGNGEGS
ncbi:MAG TPA: DUF3576 domain-containing protein [Alphaproteobacteria bacterium]|nr:DUF3576 domain-containing protein [Alphaproteobacteria bacterium]